MATDFRSQLKATSMKSLKKRIDSDDAMVGSNSTEFLNLEDGKTLKIRIFPAHPGQEDFYVPRKCYWLSVQGNDGEMRRTTVLDARQHGGYRFDLVDEYVKWAKKLIGNDAEKLEALVGTGPKSNSLNPSVTWCCYADIMRGDDMLHAKIWEFKKTVRDALNKLAMSEDPDEVIETDPFTDPDEGLPVNVTYNKNPNRKRGENYYDVAFPKKVQARPLTDEEIEYFMAQKPLSEVVPNYTMRDFDKALEGLQNFDDENEIGLFDDEAWIEHVEEIKAQFEGEDEEEDDEPKKKTTKKVVEKAAKKQAPKPEEKDEDEDEEDEDDGEEEDNDDGDEFNKMDRKQLREYILDNELDIKTKGMDEDEIRAAIRAAKAEVGESEKDEDEDDDDDEEEDEPKSKVTLNDIRKKLAKK